MDPQTVFCPNDDCPARGQVGTGNIGVHSRKDCRYRCRVCDQTFTSTKGTVFYRLRRSSELVTIVITLLAHGCPVQAIVVAFGLDERTVAAWRDRAGRHCREAHQALVQAGALDLEQVQADELRVRMCAGIVWLASALMVRTRLWLGGVVGCQHERSLADRLLSQVRASARRGSALLVCVDGWHVYPAAIRRAFREKLPRAGRSGRCRLQVWDTLVIGRVVKHIRGVWALQEEIVHGTREQLAQQLFVSQGGVRINTAFIERLNATFRECLAVLTRRCRHAVRRVAALEAGLFLVGGVYNFCTVHQALRLPNLDDPTRPRWRERTPAMASGLTDRVWTVRELLTFKVAPPPYVPPKRRGRPPKARLPQPVWTLPRRCPCPGGTSGPAVRPQIERRNQMALTTI